MSGGHLKSPEGIQPFRVVQTLNDGDNAIVHNLNKEVVGFSVKDAVGVFVEVNGDITDVNNFNINLAGGGPINNAVVILNYID